MVKFCCEESNYKMTTTQNVILRVAIVLGMMVAVVAILYLTPLPEKHFQSCDRPCHDLDWPMICRLKITLTLNNGTIAINGRTPAPPIHVCQNDVLVVDVHNLIQGHSVSMHWRGQINTEAPYMDGVPLITQCPIPSYTTFQYKFRASTPGTHAYHAYSSQDRAKGLYGALIVREPPKFDPLHAHYDSDLKNHTLLVAEGGNQLHLTGGDEGGIFRVKRHTRYRFRVVHAGGCPVTLSVDDHTIRVIGLDGNPLKAVEVDSATLAGGERLDFVLKTNRETLDYLLRVKSCRGDGSVVIRYEQSRGLGGINRQQGRRLDTSFCEQGLCLGQIEGVGGVPEKLQKDADKVIYLSFGSRTIADGNDEGSSSRVYAINNLTFTYPPSPLLTQLDQVPLSSVCDAFNVPEKCRRGGRWCECVHVEYIPLGAATELVLINRDEGEHVFHLHGYRFYVVGQRRFRSSSSVEEVKSLDRQNALFQRNGNSPMAKDTIRVPGESVVAVRFLANNPGFWMFRDEKSKGWTRGMDVVFQVGDSADMASAPTDFPTCGNYIGPDFFLM